MSDEVLATIVITPRERFSTALRCLPNVIANTDTPHHLVYVAGKAPAFIAKFLQETCDQHGYDLILRPEILSPNEARNLGLRAATTKYVVFLDNDVVVEPGWLEALVKCAEETGADVVGPVCLYGEPEDGIVHTAGGDLVVHEQDGRRWLEETHREPNVDLKVQRLELKRSQCDFVEFHCMLTPRSLFEEIGPMDEKIISAAEHLDIALLVRGRGGKTYTEPAAMISYLAGAEFLLSDAEFFAKRWSNEWYEATLDHFAAKWGLDRNSAFFKDYDSFTYRQQEHCGLPRQVWDPTTPLSLESHPFPQTAPQSALAMRRAGYATWDIESVLAANQTAMLVYRGVFREPGKSLLAHATGTAGVLAAHGAPATVLIAGLLHASYALGRFPEAVRDLASARRWLSRRVGWRAESQIIEYQRLNLEKARRAVLETDPDQLSLTLAYAILMRVANSIEEYLDAAVLFTEDPPATLARFRAQNEEWAQVYEEVARLLGAEEMLRQMAALHAQTEETQLSFTPPRPLQGANFEFADENAIVRAPFMWANSVDTPQPATVDGSGTPRRPLQERVRTKTGRKLRSYRARDFSGHNGAVVRRGLGLSRSVHLITGPPWSYACAVGLRPPDNLQGEAVVRVEATVSDGDLGLGLLLKDSTTEFVCPEQHVPAGKRVELLFRVPEVREAGALVMRSWASKPTTAVIHTVALYAVG